MKAKITGYIHDKLSNTLQLTFADADSCDLAKVKFHHALQDHPDGFMITMDVDYFQIPPGYKMNDRANPNPYAAFRESGWTDDQLITADFLQKIDDAAKN